MAVYHFAIILQYLSDILFGSARRCSENRFLNKQCTSEVANELRNLTMKSKLKLTVSDEFLVSTFLSNFPAWTTNSSERKTRLKWQSPQERSVYLRVRKSISLKLGTPKGFRRQLIKTENFF